jgi:hypothetical protein
VNVEAMSKKHLKIHPMIKSLFMNKKEESMIADIHHWFRDGNKIRISVWGTGVGLHFPT